MNEREDYLDRLLRGVEGTPEEDQGTEDELFGNYNSSFSADEEDDFLKAFEKSMSQSGDRSDLGSKTDMDFDMDDIDHIVSNVKNGTLDEFEDFGSLEDGKDLSIEESLQDYTEDNAGLDEIGTEFSSDEQDYMVNTLDGNETMEYEPEDSNQDLLKMLSGIGEETDIDEPGPGPEESEGIPGDELDSMAKELAMEIDELGIETDDELENVLAEEQEAQDAKKDKKKGKKEKKKKEKKDKGENSGFFQKLSRVLFGEEEEEDKNPDSAIPEISEIENISDENMDILRELEKKNGTPEEDEKARKKKEKKEQKAQKKKERAEKKAQKAKEKQAKPKKEKKVKEPKVVEKTKPLPKGPVFLIMLVGISLVILINLISSQLGYSLSISDAKKYYEQGDYVEAYTCFTQGKKVKAADEELYNKARLTAYVQQQINSYKMYQKQEMYAEALSALICGVGRYDKNAADAAAAGAAVEYDKMLASLEKALKKNYSMTLDEARELYDIRDREDYTYALYDKIDSLGLAE